VSNLLHVPANHPLNRLEPGLRARFVQAQTEMIDMDFRNAGDLLRRAFDDLKLKLIAPSATGGKPVGAIADLNYKSLVTFFGDLLRTSGVPEQANRRQAANLAHRVQLLRAFRDPDRIVGETVDKVSEIVAGFPRSAEHIQRGRNPGDVLDPYILAASQQLVYGGDLEGTFTATVAHKILMMIEGLLGHLHEDVVGAMRGNVRAPEPRGEDQETLNPESNPFPGADIVQPPLGERRPLRFHQVKSKTGSAKGGDGRRLGLQLLELQRLYGGEIFYDALIGSTLRGHRSMAGVLRAAPNVVVLVGESAFLALTASSIGPELLLRLYQAAFEVCAHQSGYRIQEVVEAVYGTFRQRATEAGETFLDAILHDAISGAPSEQDSRVFRRGRGPAA
jgi:hypothetical protein